ncbi:MAG: glycerophosphodiester phosphodiesterase family protein [Clostridia bacterium]|nr:glycerophosphodiester phosphodiesterase family protein [Clostridia bacterium]
MNKKFAESALLKTPIAHRGLHNADCPENSLGAYQRAIEGGYPIELDVHFSADKQIMVFHDDILERMTGRKERIGDLTAAELTKITLGNTKHTIPTFEQVLSLVDGKTPILIEVKTHAEVGGLEAALLKMLEGYGGDFALQSFNPLIVRYLSKHSEYDCGQLSSNMSDQDMPKIQKYLLTKCLLNGYAHACFTSYDARFIDGKTVKRIRRHMPVLCWTVRSERERQAVQPYCDNIIFENFEPKL